METTLNSAAVRSDITCVLRGGKEDYQFLQITIKDSAISDQVQKFIIKPEKLRIGKNDTFAKFSQNGFTYKADFKKTAYCLALYVEISDKSSQLKLKDVNTDSYIEFYFTNDQKELQPEPEQPKQAGILEEKENAIVDEFLAIQLALTMEKFEYVRVDMTNTEYSIDFIQKFCNIEGCQIGRSWNEGKYRLSFEPIADDCSRWGFDLLPYCDYFITENTAHFDFKDNQGLKICLSMY